MSDTRDRSRLQETARRVGEIMHYVWDPIGIARVPQARDEYDAYVPIVTSMLLSGASKEEIASYLTRTSTETMGLSDTPAGRAHDQAIAELLVEHLRVLNAQREKKG